MKLAPCVVTSKGRAIVRDGTVGALAKAGVPLTIICPLDEEHSYGRTWKGHHVIGTEVCKRGLSAVHQAIVEQFGPKVIIFDDDLKFAARRDLDITVPGLEPANSLQVLGMVQELTALLDTYAHAGISERFMNQEKDKEVCEAAKMISVMALRTDVLKREGIRLDRTVSKNDFDVTLQLLEKGYPNAILSRFTHDQLAGPSLPGGNTETRTLEVHAIASRRLAALHPYTVQVVEKDAKQWGTPRLDVTVRWKKAYEAGLVLHGRREL
jgi:hypothetical protein